MTVSPHYTIDAEFASVCPPLSEEESSLLEESILSDGLREPIILWNGIVIDGHNRVRICEKHGIKPKFREATFESRESAKLWIIKNQLARRNLGSVAISYLRGSIYRSMKFPKDGFKHSKTANPDGRSTQEIVGKMFGVNGSTIYSDTDLANAVDKMTPEARAFVMNKGNHARKQQVIDLGQLDSEVQDTIVAQIRTGKLLNLEKAIRRLRPPARMNSGNGETNKRGKKCPGCGARLAVGVDTCLACDITSGEAIRRLNVDSPEKAKKSPEGLAQCDQCGEICRKKGQRICDKCAGEKEDDAQDSEELRNRIGEARTHQELETTVIDEGPRIARALTMLSRSKIAPSGKVHTVIKKLRYSLGHFETEPATSRR